MEGKALGDNKPAYIRILRSWFKRHYFKEDFDPSVLFLLPPEEVLLHNRYLTAILVKHMQTYTKQARRRSKSVDHYVGERTVIAPELCQICEASKKSRAEDMGTFTRIEKGISVALSSVTITEYNGGLLNDSHRKKVFKQETDVNLYGYYLKFWKFDFRILLKVSAPLGKWTMSILQYYSVYSLN